MELELHKHAEQIALALRELNYWDLAEIIEYGKDFKEGFRKKFEQEDYNQYIEQAKEIFEENGYSPAQVKSIDHKNCLI